MATESPQSGPAWLHAKALWAGLSIITMWLAVLFVGIFGGDFVHNSATGSTTFPMVVFLLPFVLPATIAVARRGFASVSHEQHEETHGGEETTTAPTTLTAKPAV